MIGDADKLNLSDDPSGKPPPYTPQPALPFGFQDIQASSSPFAKEHATQSGNNTGIRGAKSISIFDRDAKCVRSALVLCHYYSVLIWFSVTARHYSAIVVTAAMTKVVAVQQK